MVYTLKDLQHLVYSEYKKNGYEYMWNLEDLKMLLRNVFYSADGLKAYFDGNQFRQLQIIADIGEVGLINTEVSELLEDIRKDEQLEKQGEECADIIIRVLNYCNRKGIDAEHHVLKKHRKNIKRDKLHGRVV